MIINAAARNGMCDFLVDLLDAGAGAATLKFYTGLAPAGPDSAVTGTLLATLVMDDPAFGAAAIGVATAGAIADDTSIDASGTAGYARLADSDGNGVADLSVGVGSGDIQFNTLDWTAGDTLSVSSLTITQPSGA